MAVGPAYPLVEHLRVVSYYAALSRAAFLREEPCYCAACQRNFLEGLELIHALAAAGVARGAPEAPEMLRAASQALAGDWQQIHRLASALALNELAEGEDGP